MGRRLNSNGKTQECEVETLNDEFVIEMEKYFSLQKPIKLLRNKKIE